MRAAQAARRARSRLCYKGRVRREFSAGGVVVRRLRGRWMLAAIRPGGKPTGTSSLPKGLVSSGEAPEVTAAREVTEETGVAATLVTKLGYVRYIPTRGGWRMFKGARDRKRTRL